MSNQIPPEVAALMVVAAHEVIATPWVEARADGSVKLHHAPPDVKQIYQAMEGARIEAGCFSMAEQVATLLAKELTKRSLDSLEAMIAELDDLRAFRAARNVPPGIGGSAEPISLKDWPKNPTPDRASPRRKR